MLKKRYRFHSRGGVRYVYQKGKTIRSPKISLVHVNNVRGFTRVAVVVSKKIEKKAVDRNRIRRRVYEVIRADFERIPKGVDYVFVIYSKMVRKMEDKELKGAVRELVDEAAVCYNRDK